MLEVVLFQPATSRNPTCPSPPGGMRSFEFLRGCRIVVVYYHGLVFVLGAANSSVSRGVVDRRLFVSTTCPSPVVMAPETNDKRLEV